MLVETSEINYLPSAAWIRREISAEGAKSCTTFLDESFAKIAERKCRGAGFILFLESVRLARHRRSLQDSTVCGVMARMRKASIAMIAGIVAVAALAGGIFAFQKYRHAQQQAIVVVFQKRTEARQLLTDPTWHPKNKAKTRLQAYSSVLDGIDATGCPQDFRAAWFDYAQAWNLMAYHQLGGIGDTAEFAVGVRVNNADLLKDSVSAIRSRDRNAAFAKDKRAALDYGIQAPPD